MLSYILVRLVQTYSVIENRNSSSFVAKVRISMTNKQGVWVEMKPDVQAV
jgi:hypothetical protein